MVARLSTLHDELRSFSPASLVAASLVITKILRVSGRLIDVALEEMLKRQSLYMSTMLLMSSVSGWFSLYAYRSTIADHLDASARATLHSSNAVGEVTDGGLEEGAEWYMQLLRNLKRLPNIFWFSQAATWLVTLQMSQRVGVRAIQFGSRSIAGTLLLQLAGLFVIVVAWQAEKMSAAHGQDLQRLTQRLLLRLRRANSLHSNSEEYVVCNDEQSASAQAEDSTDRPER